METQLWLSIGLDVQFSLFGDHRLKKSDSASVEIGLAVLAVITSAVCWLLAGLGNNALSGLTGHSPGVDLLYLPAGIRLGLILVFRGWGALGIIMADPILFHVNLGHGSMVEIAVNSLAAGAIPLLVVLVTGWALRIDHTLSGLSPLVLVAMAFLASVATPLAFSLVALGTGRIDVQELPTRLSAMILGDFLGCLLVLVLTSAIIRCSRRFG